MNHVICVAAVRKQYQVNITAGLTLTKPIQIMWGKKMRYRKKPIIVEANQWFPQPPPISATEDTPGKPRKPELYGVKYFPPARIDASGSRGIKFDQPGRYVVDTLEGQMQVHPGDWIVSGVTGERYPVKPHIFSLTYELASGPSFRRCRSLGPAAAAVGIAAFTGIAYYLIVWVWLR